MVNMSKKLHAVFTMEEAHNITFCMYCGNRDTVRHELYTKHEVVECDNCRNHLRLEKRPKQETYALLEYMERLIHHTKSHIHHIREHHGEIEHNNGVVNKHGGWDLGYHEGRLSILENMRLSILEGDFE